MNIYVISDTHNHHDQYEIPSGIDVLIHCGDFSDEGTPVEYWPFLKWFASLPTKYKILVRGNHDQLNFDHEMVAFCNENNIILGWTEVFVIENVRFVCSPSRGHVQELYKKDFDVLISHYPAWYVLDKTDQLHHVGCLKLRALIDRKRPSIFLHGHIHESHGMTKHNKTLVVNAANTKEKKGYRLYVQN